MTTVVNNPGGATTDNSLGTIFTVLMIALLAILFFVYGLPAIRNAASPSINVPSSIDVNLPANNGNGGNTDGGSQ